ncbi:unnamed protein product [Angiostrongylus costaricensis]|uniref:Uncharacterized protein n=1 Tax=Angiostrongylus costaricensis TaxID=334426 RepID=A0A158PKH6_ANGCS|nr:unnamed protein product [Angiostrongylus costaricensis]
MRSMLSHVGGIESNLHLVFSLRRSNGARLSPKPICDRQTKEYRWTTFPLSVLISVVDYDDDVARLGGLSTMCETAGGEPTDSRCCRRPPLRRRLWALAACRSALSVASTVCSRLERRRRPPPPASVCVQAAAARSRVIPSA